MTNPSATNPFLEHSQEQLILMEQLKRAELFNGRAAMLGIVIGMATEALTGSGIAVVDLNRFYRLTQPAPSGAQCGRPAPSGRASCESCGTPPGDGIRGWASGSSPAAAEATASATALALPGLLA